MRRLSRVACILTTTFFAALGLSAVPAAAAEPTPAVCTKTAKTVEDGLTVFARELSNVTKAADSGDMTAADQSVKKAGTSLVDLAANLRTDAATADAADVKTTLGQLADEFEAQGKSLTTVESLQKLDVTRIDALSDQMIAICAAASSTTTPTPR
ncbi:hypothetical protein CS0771_21210 [Catellatospora sp. IY07-71]|uniref:hypothetical protein n=1 Tax=Catellatospora sp. IY07-71 TaxID=2728827 RepID=UPI001BB2FC62|nr:hypothetical protein [Catellatospora sp. IY07-71]BCJ72577.1 hypothetical protein CS0771_21210 [Catellatospora sp. IY07-71]